VAHRRNEQSLGAAILASALPDEALVTLEFRSCPFDDAPAAMPVAQMLEEMAGLYDGSDIRQRRDAAGWSRRARASWRGVRC
jgi:hypothetical protein